jgi:hypothetical protein
MICKLLVLLFSAEQAAEKDICKYARYHLRNCGSICFLWIRNANFEFVVYSFRGLRPYAQVFI